MVYQCRNARCEDLRCASTSKVSTRDQTAAQSSAVIIPVGTVENAQMKFIFVHVDLDETLSSTQSDASQMII